MYFSLIHQRTTRTINKEITTRTTKKEIEQGHIKSSGRKAYRATLVMIVKKYSRVKQSVYTSTPSQTVNLLTLLALPLLTIASNAAPLRRILRHMPLRIAPPSTSLPFQLLHALSRHPFQGIESRQRYRHKNPFVDRGVAHPRRCSSGSAGQPARQPTASQQPLF